jgi:hypothetical protein
MAAPHGAQKPGTGASQGTIVVTSRREQRELLVRVAPRDGVRLLLNLKAQLDELLLLIGLTEQ